MQEIGAIFAVDYSRETPVVVNVLEVKDTRMYQEAMIRYADAGYAAKTEEAVLVYYCNTAADFVAEGASSVVIPADTASYKTISGSGIVSGIAATTKYKQEALQLLALIAEDEEFRMHMAYGKEGQDYRIGADDSSYSLHEGTAAYGFRW